MASKVVRALLIVASSLLLVAHLQKRGFIRLPIPSLSFLAPGADRLKEPPAPAMAKHGKGASDGLLTPAGSTGATRRWHLDGEQEKLMAEVGVANARDGQTQRQKQVQHMDLSEAESCESFEACPKGTAPVASPSLVSCSPVCTVELCCTTEEEPQVVMDIDEVDPIDGFIAKKSARANQRKLSVAEADNATSTPTATTTTITATATTTVTATETMTGTTSTDTVTTTTTATTASATTATVATVNATTTATATTTENATTATTATVTTVTATTTATAITTTETTATATTTTATTATATTATATTATATTATTTIGTSSTLGAEEGGNEPCINGTNASENSTGCTTQTSATFTTSTTAPPSESDTTTATATTTTGTSVSTSNTTTTVSTSTATTATAATTSTIATTTTLAAATTTFTPAGATAVVITGSMTLSVAPTNGNSIEDFLADADVIAAVKQSIAQISGTDPSWVQDITLSFTRRLQDGPHKLRRLQFATVSVEYTIVIPNDVEVDASRHLVITDAINDVNINVLTTTLQGFLGESASSFSVAVTGIVAAAEFLPQTTTREKVEEPDLNSHANAHVGFMMAHTVAAAAVLLSLLA